MSQSNLRGERQVVSRGGETEPKSRKQEAEKERETMQAGSELSRGLGRSMTRAHAHPPEIAHPGRSLSGNSRQREGRLG